MDEATVNRSLLVGAAPAQLPAIAPLPPNVESQTSNPAASFDPSAVHDEDPRPEWMRSSPLAQPVPAGSTPARVSARLFAQLADGAVFFAVSLPVYAILGFMVAGAPDALGATWLLFFFSYIGGPLLVATYIVRRIASTGQTIGKRWLGVKVVDADTGLPIGIERSITRYLMLIVMGLPFNLGYLSILSDKTGRNRGWHDKAADTIVVSV